MELSKILLLWFGAVSVLLFVLMGADKAAARAHKRRIPEARLFFFAVLGGAIGGTAGMYVFRHKTKHWYFALFFPLLALAQAALLLWVK